MRKIIKELISIQGFIHPSMSAIDPNEYLFDSSYTDTLFSILVSEFSGKDFTVEDIKTNEKIQKFIDISEKEKKESHKKKSTEKLSVKEEDIELFSL